MLHAPPPPPVLSSNCILQVNLQLPQINLQLPPNSKRTNILPVMMLLCAYSICCKGLHCTMHRPTHNFVLHEYTWYPFCMEPFAACHKTWKGWCTYRKANSEEAASGTKASIKTQSEKGWTFLVCIKEGCISRKVVPRASTQTLPHTKGFS